MKRTSVLAVSLLCSSLAQAAEPVKIGITTILSGPTADRGQQEQYGAQLALNWINQAGGVLGRPVEALYADNACKPDIGVPATKRLLEQEHVPVIIGARSRQSPRRPSDACRSPASPRRASRRRRGSPATAPESPSVGGW